ncbi:MAG: hypothetical protein CMH52_13520 [Myxococcales bacterium]|nr:hypothetical protein [Myxococcales bacterium]
MLIALCCLFSANTAWCTVQWPSNISVSAPDRQGLEQLRSQTVGQKMDVHGLVLESRPCDVVNLSKTHKDDCHVLSIRGVGGHSMIIYANTKMTDDAQPKLGTHIVLKGCLGLHVLRWGLATRSFCDAATKTTLRTRADAAQLEGGDQTASESRPSEWTQLARKLKSAKRKNEAVDPKTLLNTELRGTGMVLTKTKCDLLSPVRQLIPDCLRLELKSGHSRLTVYLTAPAAGAKKAPKIGRRFRFRKCTVLTVEDWSVWTQLTCAIYRAG